MKRINTVVDPIPIAAAVRTSIDAFLHTMPDAVPSEFPERIERLAVNVALWGSKMNLTAHPEDPAEIAFHVVDSLMPVILSIDKSSILTDRFSKAGNRLDLGSGAGFPGLVLAAAAPAGDFTLVESRRKRASFLQVAVAEMGLRNVTIESRRAEEIGLHGQFDLVTARAFGDAEDFFALSARALKPGGLAMLYASASQRFSIDVTRIPYSVASGGRRAERILAVWRRE